MPKQTERIKISSFIKKSLDMLKTEENWSYGLVISALLLEHDTLIDPDIIAERERKINNDYVKRPDYDRVYEQNVGYAEKIEELERDLEIQLGELRGNEEDSILKLKGLQFNCDKLKNVLVVKEEEIKTAKIENEDLNQKLDQLHFILSDIQKKYDKCESDYKHFSNYIDGVYLLTDEKLETLTRVIFFLSALLNKRRVFTLDQLTDKLIHCRGSEIEEVIPLFKYKIFPVERYLVDGVECFGFDRHYLKR